MIPRSGKRRNSLCTRYVLSYLTLLLGTCNCRVCFTVLQSKYCNLAREGKKKIQIPTGCGNCEQGRAIYPASSVCYNLIFIKQNLTATRPTESRMRFEPNRGIYTLKSASITLSRNTLPNFR